MARPRLTVLRVPPTDRLVPLTVLRDLLTDRPDLPTDRRVPLDTVPALTAAL